MNRAARLDLLLSSTTRNSGLQRFSSGSLLRIEKEGGQVLWNVRFRRGELSYLDFGFPSSSKPSVLANCSCGKVCLDRTTAARWGPLSPCGG